MLQFLKKMLETYEVFKLSARLLDDAVLAIENDAHPTEVAHLRRADHERVDVESSGCENPGDAREHAWLVLDEAVEDVSTDFTRTIHQVCDN